MSKSPSLLDKVGRVGPIPRVQKQTPPQILLVLIIKAILFLPPKGYLIY